MGCDGAPRYGVRQVMAMRRTLLPVLAMIVAAGTACGSSGGGGAGAPSTPAATVTATATTTVTTTAPTPSATEPTTHGPRAVVEAFYDAVNARDYRTAWRLGGKNLGRTYNAFVAGFADTAHDRLQVRGVSGATVSVDLWATRTSGATVHYKGTYVVSGGEITHGRMTLMAEPGQGGGTPSQPAGGFVHPGAFCSPVGATGVTDRGTPMVCSTTASDSYARWRHR